MVRRTEGNTDDLFIGGNTSTGGPEGEGTENRVTAGPEPSLTETSCTKEAYKKHVKDYIKSVKGILEEQQPERVKPFMTGATEHIKHILANCKNYQFFSDENMDREGMLALWDYSEDGGNPHRIFFKDGVEMEKC